MAQPCGADLSAPRPSRLLTGGLQVRDQSGESREPYKAQPNEWAACYALSRMRLCPVRATTGCRHDLGRRPSPGSSPWLIDATERRNLRGSANESGSEVRRLRCRVGRIRRQRPRASPRHSQRIRGSNAVFAASRGSRAGRLRARSAAGSLSDVPGGRAAPSRWAYPQRSRDRRVPARGCVPACLNRAACVIAPWGYRPRRRPLEALRFESHCPAAPILERRRPASTFDGGGASIGNRRLLRPPRPLGL